MKIVNISKDGKVIENLREVVVPKEIVRNVNDIVNRKTEVKGS